jgi:hypothetical protein
LDAVPVSQLLQLAQGGFVLFEITKHDPKAWPVALKVFEKPFGLCAMRAALADKDLDARLLTRSLDCGARRRAGQSGQEECQDEESVRGHDSVATQDVSPHYSWRNRAVALRDGQARRRLVAAANPRLQQKRS